jgi:hypothetical protein
MQLWTLACKNATAVVVVYYCSIAEAGCAGWGRAGRCSQAGAHQTAQQQHSNKAQNRQEYT